MSQTQEATNHLKIVLMNTPKDAGFIELRTFSDKTRGKANQYFLPTGANETEIEKAVNWCERENQKGRGVFIGYNPRFETNGEKSSVQRYSAAYVDLDLDKKGIPVEKALEKVAESPIKPDLIVNSGGGLHVIHFFEPTENYAEWTALQRSLADHYSEVGADNAIVTDTARVLRLAPFLNQKEVYETPRKTEVLEFHAKERRPSFSTMTEVFHADDILIAGKSAKLPSEIEAGGSAAYSGRNDLLFREASALRNRGYGFEELLALLLSVNENRCSPPLDVDEVEAIARQAAKYEISGDLVVIPEEEIKQLGKTYGVFKNTVFPSIEPVIFGLTRGEWGLLQAKSNIGKTTLTLNMILSAACGREFYPFIEAGRPKRVMYLDFENRASFLQMDLARMAKNFDDSEQYLIEDNTLFLVDETLEGSLLSLSNPAHFNAVVERAVDFNPEIIIVDTLAAGFTLANENDNAEMKRVVIDPVKRLTKATDAVALIVHHIGKAGENQDASKLYRGRGASSLPSDARVVLDIDNLRDGDKKPIKGFINLHCAKVKGAPFEDVTFQLDFERRWFEQSDGSVSAQTGNQTSSTERIWMIVDRQMSRKEILEAVEAAGMTASESTVRRALLLAVQSGLMTQESRGSYAPTDELRKRMGLPPLGIAEPTIDEINEANEQMEQNEFDEVVSILDEAPFETGKKSNNVVDFVGRLKVEVADEDGSFAEVKNA